MKYLLVLTIFLSQTALALPKKKYYINTPQGPVQVITPQDLRTMKKNEGKNRQLDGTGQEFLGQVKVQSGKISAWIRGCENVQIGDLNDENNDEETVKRLKTLKNGDRVKLRMSGFGSCQVADWKK